MCFDLFFCEGCRYLRVGEKAVLGGGGNEFIAADPHLGLQRSQMAAGRRWEADGVFIIEKTLLIESPVVLQWWNLRVDGDLGFEAPQACMKVLAQAEAVHTVSPFTSLFIATSAATRSPSDQGGVILGMEVRLCDSAWVVTSPRRVLVKVSLLKDSISCPRESLCAGINVGDQRGVGDTEVN